MGNDRELIIGVLDFFVSRHEQKSLTPDQTGKASLVSINSEIPALASH